MPMTEKSLRELLCFIDSEIAKLDACLELSDVREAQVRVRIDELRVIRLRATAKERSL